MKPNAKLLAGRDPAVFAALGLTSESTFGNEFGADFGADFGDDYGADFGDDVGAEAPVNAQAVVRQAMAARQKGAKRGSLLRPNAGSSIKVERYTMALSNPIVFGAASALNLAGNPDTEFRPQRIVTNAPCSMFATLVQLQAANVNVISGGGSVDAYNWNPNSVGQMMDLPTLTPANRVRALGTYSGYTPPGFVVGATTEFSLQLTGPASVVG